MRPVTLVGAAVLAGCFAPVQTSRTPPRPPPAEPPFAEIWTKSARRAAQSGDCATVVMLGKRVADRDAHHHARVFLLDPDIARCVSKSALPPPPDRRHAGVGTKVGVGLGAPYGGEIGIGGEVGLAHAGVVASMGVAGRSLGWSVGLRTYLRDRFAFVRPHVTTLYGTTAVYIERVWSGMDWQRVRHTLRGVGVYAGVDVDVGHPGAFRLTIAGGLSWQPDAPAELSEESWIAPSLVLGVDHEW